jgi:hypothetical protein
MKPRFDDVAGIAFSYRWPAGAQRNEILPTRQKLPRSELSMRARQNLPRIRVFMYGMACVTA